MKYMKRNCIKKVRVIVKDDDKEIMDIFKEVLNEHNLDMTDEDSDLIIIVGNYTTFSTGCNITNFNENSIYVGINILNFKNTSGLKKEIEKFVKYITETNDFNIVRIPLIGVNISQKYGIPEKVKAINNVDILGKLKYEEKFDGLLLQTCYSSGIRITSNIGGIIWSDQNNLSRFHNEDKRLIRTIGEYDYNEFIPFFANPISCSNYKVIIDKIYEDVTLKIDGNEYNEVNTKEILAVETEYLNKYITVLYLDEKFLFMDLLKLSSMI